MPPWFYLCLECSDGVGRYKYLAIAALLIICTLHGFVVGAVGVAAVVVATFVFLLITGCFLVGEVLVLGFVEEDPGVAKGLLHQSQI